MDRVKEKSQSRKSDLLLEFYLGIFALDVVYSSIVNYNKPTAANVSFLHHTSFSDLLLNSVLSSQLTKFTISFDFPLTLPLFQAYTKSLNQFNINSITQNSIFWSRTQFTV